MKERQFPDVGSYVGTILIVCGLFVILTNKTIAILPHRECGCILNSKFEIKVLSASVFKACQNVSIGSCCGTHANVMMENEMKKYVDVWKMTGITIKKMKDSGFQMNASGFGVIFLTIIAVVALVV